jgi:hypothetical protein
LKGAGKRLREILETRMILVFDMIERDSQGKRMKYIWEMVIKRRAAHLLQMPINRMYNWS